jgi:hypothetical protein
MPKSDVDGLIRVCDERKYAYISTDLYMRQIASSLSCQLLSLPGTTYNEILTYIISKTSHYKGLINWRLSSIHNSINYFRYCYQTDQKMYMHSILTSANFNNISEKQMFTSFDKYIVPLVLKTNS